MRVVENLYRSSDWNITSQTVDGEAAEYEKLDSNTVQWDVPVPAGGETELVYTVQYLWK